MPLIKTYYFKDLSIYVWNIKESINELLNYARDYKLLDFDGINDNNRLKQFIASRICLAKALNLAYVPILTKTYSGKPILTNSNKNFSISHCNNLAIVAISTYPVGVDIQNPSNKIYKVKDKFLCKHEQNILLNKAITFNYLLYLQRLCICWTSKEAIYKLLNLTNISFKRDLKILHINNKNKYVKVNFITKDIYKIFDLKYLFIDNYCISYVLNKNDI